MASNIVFKLKILRKVKGTLRNWRTFVCAYFGFIKNKYVTLETKTGIKIRLRTNSTDLMAFIHVWLIQEYSRQGFEIKENDIIVDIGAHIGLFALYASQSCKKGKIYCFEPVKLNFDLLIGNLELNKTQNITPFNLAVSENAEKIKIFINQDDAGHSMFVPSDKFIEANSISIKQIFDQNNIEKCNFLKLDCEGAEYEIIDSLPQNYFDKIEKMIIEYHFANTKPALLENLTKKLESLSYKVDRKKLFEDIGFLYVVRS